MERSNVKEMEVIKDNQPVIDKDWEQLIYEAKTIGLTIEEIRNFLLEKKEKKKTIIYVDK